jgi:hypothetical protein
MPICPPKKGTPFAESSGYNKLVKDIQDKFKVDEDTAWKIADHAFHSNNGEMPTVDVASQIINKDLGFTKKKTIKQGIANLFKAIREKTQADLGYRFGFAEASLAGEIAGKRAGRKEGVAEQKSFQKEFAERVNQYLKTNEKLRGKLSEKQVESIARKAANIGTSERAFAKFTDYLDKVISDENYATDLETAQSLKSSIKKSFADSNDFVKRMKGLDIERLTPEQLKEFNKLAQDYINSTKKVTGEKYEPFELQKSLDKLKEFEKAVDDSIIKETEAAYDLEGLTKEEADLLNEYTAAEDKDAFEANLTEAKKKVLRYNLERTADYALLGLKEKLANRQAVVDKFGEDFTKQLEDISNADLSLITNNKDLAELIKTVNNAIINNSKANVGKVNSFVRAYIDLPKLQKLSATVIKPIIGAARKIYYDTPIILKAIFGNRNVSAAVRRLTGYDGVLSAASKAEIETLSKNKLWDKFKKENKIDNSAETDALMGVYSRLSDVRKGFENEDFLNEKTQLEQTIKRLSESENADDVFFSNYLKNIYDGFIKDVNTYDEFVKTFNEKHPDVVKGVNWVSENMWKEQKENFKNHAEANLNETFDGNERDAYQPKAYYKVKGFEEIASPGDPNFDILTGKPKETGRSMARTLKDKLPKDKVVDYRFEYNTFKNYQEQLFEINSFADAMTMYKMSSLNGFNEIFGGEKNANFFKKTYNIQYDLLRNGKRMNDELSKSALASSLRSLKNIGTAIGLGRFSQILSQSTPAINAMIQNPLYFSKVLATKGLNNIELFNLSTIGARGVEMGAAGKAETIQSLGYNKIKTGYKALLNSIQKITGKARELTLKPLSAADVNVAKKSFLSYYLKYMNENGVKVEAKDLPTEHLRMDDLRKKALSYAQQAVDETQGVSNRAMLSELKRNDNGSFVQEVATNVLAPFNNFASNTKARIIEDVNKITFGNNSQKVEASKDLIGTVAESAAFAAVNAFVVTGVLRYGLKKVLAKAFGIDAEQEDFYELMSKKVKEFYTGIVREITLSGLGGEVEAAGIEILNQFAYKMQKLSGNESGKDYYTWLKEEPLFKPSFKPLEGSKTDAVLNNLGAYGIGLRTAQETATTIKEAATGEATTQYQFQKETGKEDKTTQLKGLVTEKKELTQEEKNFYAMLGLLKGFSLLGLGEQDILRAAQSIKYDILKSKNEPKGSSGKSPLGPQGFSGGGLGKQGPE